MRPWLAAAPLSVLVTLVMPACVAREHREMVEARDAYEECVGRHGASHPECGPLRERSLESQDRYGENARRAWSCGPQDEECPRER